MAHNTHQKLDLGEKMRRETQEFLSEALRTVRDPKALLEEVLQALWRLCVDPPPAADPSDRPRRHAAATRPAGRDRQNG